MTSLAPSNDGSGAATPAKGPKLPRRYEALSRLGEGGAGEVWAVRDRYCGRRYALKILSRDAGDGEAASLVKEAVALSGLEGLGVPRVISFGKLPGSRRVYMLRELVEGESLEARIQSAQPILSCLGALAVAAEKLRRVHRSGLLHGDIKPANVIVNSSGDATLVDLGLSQPFREHGTRASGLTPKYAAPELLRGGPLTVRAEIHALGVALSDILNMPSLGELPADQRERLREVHARATALEPQERYPSADEFAAALRRAASLEETAMSLSDAALWPVTGIESVASRLLSATLELPPAGVLVLCGPAGSGRTVLLTRLAWSLGAEGEPLVWVDESLIDHHEAIAAEIEALPSMKGATLVVDAAERVDEENAKLLDAARRRGARLVITTPSSTLSRRLGETLRFDVPPLAQQTAAELIRRAVPSLTPRVVQRLIESAEGRPGALKRLIGRIATAPVVSEQDIERLIGADVRSERTEPRSLERLEELLNRGRFSEASGLLAEGVRGAAVPLATARARLAIGLGQVEHALEVLEAVRAEAEACADEEAGRAWRLWLARAHVGALRHSVAIELLDDLVNVPGALGAEALTYRGLALFHSGRAEEAQRQLDLATERAREAGASRVEGLALICAGRVHTRAERNDEAREAFAAALRAAERASDASTLATAQSQVAVLLRMRGDIAGALRHFQAAIDAGRRSGRLAVVRLCLANLANTDLYLGRLQRARASIDELKAQREELGDPGRAQLLGLEADLHAGSGDVQAAIVGYRRCANAFEKLGQNEASAEARLSAVLLTPPESSADPDPLLADIARSRRQLGDSPTHRPLLSLAEARVAQLTELDARARELLEKALLEAEDTDQPEWVWRTLTARAELQATGGQPLMAQRDRERALLVLEQMAAQLPRDLREVFWNDRERSKLRASTLEGAPARPTAVPSLGATVHSLSPISENTRTPLERRLARILEINQELLGEFDLERLAGLVVGCALEMLGAEHGFVLLRRDDDSLSVHTSRNQRGDEVHAEFSRSIAERVMAGRSPVVSLDARHDARMQGYASVHQLMLRAVACVPIRARRGEPIGALYLETKLEPGREFERELPTLCAFADQVGLAIATARLVTENVNRAQELARANEKLEEAQVRLQELLGDRTQKLKLARRRLRDARDTLYGHFGYQGMVGTSSAMRRLYSMIERLKDTDVPVLVSGESGTGKEVAARAIHRASQRSTAPFLGINCGAIPEHLLESELFGHVRGAFTGADRERKGLIREAGKGTVLLDEIGEMPQKMQAGLLRVLQERCVRPVGATTEEPVHCHFMFATHRDLQTMVKEGRFREDLYYRIMVVELSVPPLRDRVEDIPLLVDYFLGLFSARYKRDKKALTRDALRRLSDYRWPGNVRQLEHVLLNAWVLSDQPEIDAADLELPASAGPSSKTKSPPSRTTPRKKRRSLSSHHDDEKSRICEALSACNWNRVKAAEMLGMPRRTFYRRLKQYGLQ